MDLSKIKEEEEEGSKWQSEEKPRENTVEYEVSKRIKEEQEKESDESDETPKTDGMQLKKEGEPDNMKHVGEALSFLVATCFRQPKVLLRRLEEIMDISVPVLLNPHLVASTGYQGMSSLPRWDKHLPMSEEKPVRQEGLAMTRKRKIRVTFECPVKDSSEKKIHAQTSYKSGRKAQCRESTPAKVPTQQALKTVSPPPPPATLEELFASDFMEESYTEEWAVKSFVTLDNFQEHYDESGEMGGGDSGEIDDGNEDDGYVAMDEDSDDDHDNDDCERDVDINCTQTYIPEKRPSEKEKGKRIPQMGKSCGPMCRKKCNVKLTEHRRRQIFNAYWNMSYGDKRVFLFHMVSQQQKMRLTTAGASRRSKTLLYHLNNDLSQRQQVCKTFFLTTLGYHPKNDRVIVSVIGNSTLSILTPPQDRRGRHAPANKLNMAPIYEHIESFHPTISHYRHEHAPNRRYLPSDVNIMMMYKDFKQKKAVTCSYETYRKAVKEKNISFTKLGEEECEHCFKHDVPMKTEHHKENTCNQEVENCDPTPDCPPVQSGRSISREQRGANNIISLMPRKIQPQDPLHLQR